MNKTIIGCTLGLVATGITTTAAILVAIWMTWADTNQRLVNLETRVARVEGLLIGRGNMLPPEETAAHE